MGTKRKPPPVRLFLKQPRHADFHPLRARLLCCPGGCFPLISGPGRFKAQTAAGSGPRPRRCCRKKGSALPPPSRSPQGSSRRRGLPWHLPPSSAVRDPASRAAPCKHLPKARTACDLCTHPSPWSPPKPLGPPTAASQVRGRTQRIGRPERPGGEESALKGAPRSRGNGLTLTSQGRGTPEEG